MLLSGLLLTNCEIKDNHTATSRPNIILFLVDDMGWQDTSVPFWKEKTDFNRRYHTPNMERLAAEGMKFTQAYATPVCSPTRISLMTGMNAARHRVTNWTLHKDVLKPREEDHPTLEFPLWNVNGLTPDASIPNAVLATPLPAVLKKGGYKTIHVGKAHLGAIGTPGENPLNLGFDINIAGHAAGAPQSFYGKENFGNTESFKHTPWPVPGLEKYYGQDIFLTEALTREAKAALEQALNERTPFFLYMSLYAVHAPIMADHRFYQTYLDQGLDTIEAKYASMVESMDKSLGDLMDFTVEKKIDQNTIILFMSDNGGLSAIARGGLPHTHNQPLASGKGSIYEGGIREPMLVKWPGRVEPNSINANYLIIEDFFPTILEVAGMEEPGLLQKIDGQSFVDFLSDPKPQIQNRALFWHYPNEWGPSGPGIGAYSAIRKGDWKLIYYHQNESFELFNISKDISETQDLVEEETALAKRLAVELEQYLKSVDAQMPVHKPSGESVAWPAISMKVLFDE
jgi:arylsulfatase A-like enzyme